MVNPITQLPPVLASTVDAARTAMASLPEDRINLLHGLAQKMAQYYQAHGQLQLVFICIHNSRRSHLSEVWARFFADYLGLEGLLTYSGGTVATAFDPRAVAALERAGFVITKVEEENPPYVVRYGAKEPVVCFSKKFDHPMNPSHNFFALMTCSETETECPYVPGAVVRQPVTFEDPSVGDGTPQEEQVYSSRSLEIASNMLFLLERYQVLLTA